MLIIFLELNIFIISFSIFESPELTKMTSFGLIIGSGNRYELNHEEIKYLEKEINQEK